MQDTQLEREFAPPSPVPVDPGTPESRTALSPVDRALIARLQRDGRIPFSVLAAELSVSEATVQRRTQQLMDEGYFTIVGVIDPIRLGSGLAVLIGINADPTAIDTLSDALVRIPDVRFVASVTGAFDVVCEVVTLNRSSLTRILMQEITRIPGIRAMNTSWVISNEKTNHLWEDRNAEGPGVIGPPHPEPVPFWQQLDELDRGIIGLLQQRGRMTYADLAAALGTTESTARRRTLRLFQSEYVRVVAVGHPFRLGFEEVVLIWLKVDLSHSRDIIDELSRHPAIRYLSRVAGTVDIVAEALFPNQTALAAFIDGPLATIEGIREVSLSFELTIHKRAYVRFDEKQSTA